MASPLEQQAAGKKRACPSEREMEKCDPCRRKRIKVSYDRGMDVPRIYGMSFIFFGIGPNCCQCLPTERDWSKGVKCNACERKNDECGPNVRANRPARPINHTQAAAPAGQPLSPSNILRQVPPGVPSEHTKAAQQLESEGSELDKHLLHGSLRMSTGANIRIIQNEAQEDEYPEKRNHIASRYAGFLPPCARLRSDGRCTIVSCGWVTSA